MPYFHTPRGKLHYIVMGHGPPLIPLHGAWASHAWWKEQIKDLSSDYTIYAIDMLGHGGSSDLEGASSIEEFSDCLYQFMIRENIPDAVLVGWSMGGFIGMQMAMDHPERVRGLILIAARAQRSPRMKARVIFQYFKNLLTMLAIFSEPRNYKKSRPREGAFVNPWLKTEARKHLSRDATPDLVDWMAAEMAKTPFRNYFEIARSIWNWNPAEKISSIQAPTLIMAGDQDSIVSPKYSEFIANHIPGSSLKILEAAGHYCILDDARRVNRSIREFLKDMGYV